MNWYKKASSEKEYYETVGENYLSELKTQIQTIVGGNLIITKERACINIPSNVKWYEKEYKLQDKHMEMSRLQAEISEVKSPFDIYLISVFINVNKDGKFLFTGDVYEKEHDPEYHKLIDQKQNQKPTYDISNTILRSQADKIPLGFFGKTIIPQNFKIKLGYARTPEEAAKRIKEIIWHNEPNKNKEEPPQPLENPINTPSKELQFASSFKNNTNWYKLSQKMFAGSDKLSRLITDLVINAWDNEISQKILNSFPDAKIPPDVKMPPSKKIVDPDTLFKLTAQILMPIVNKKIQEGKLKNENIPEIQDNINKLTAKGMSVNAHFREYNVDKDPMAYFDGQRIAININLKAFLVNEWDQEKIEINHAKLENAIYHEVQHFYLDSLNDCILSVEKNQFKHPYPKYVEKKIQKQDPQPIKDSYQEAPSEYQAFIGGYAANLYKLYIQYKLRKYEELTPQILALNKTNKTLLSKLFLELNKNKLITVEKFNVDNLNNQQKNDIYQSATRMIEDKIKDLQKEQENKPTPESILTKYENEIISNIGKEELQNILKKVFLNIVYVSVNDKKIDKYFNNIRTAAEIYTSFVKKYMKISNPKTIAAKLMKTLHERISPITSYLIKL